MPIRRFIIIVVIVNALGALSPMLLSHILPNDKFNVFFGHILPCLLVLAPLLVGTLARVYRLEGALGEQQAISVKRLTRRLWMATAASLAIIAIAFPSEMTMFLSLAFFFILNFGFVGPLVRAKNPSSNPVFMPERTRAATLTPHQSGKVPAWAWLLAWMVWFATAVHFLPFLAIRANNAHRDIIICLIVTGLPLIMAPFIIRFWPPSAEPMNPEGSERLASLYSQMRQLKAWGIWLFTLEWMILMCLHGVFVVWDMREMYKMESVFAGLMFSVTMPLVFMGYYARRVEASRLLKRLCENSEMPAAAGNSIH